MNTVSVIIPAYNCVSFLADSLESVDAKGVETIVVDDGSTDGTAEMVRSRFPLVHVFSQENQGVSKARNVGLDRSNGRYVVFLDADDLLKRGALQTLCDALEKQHEEDIVILRSFASDGEHYPWTGRFESGKSYMKGDIIRSGYVRGSVCGCAFSRDYLLKNRLRFPEGVAMGEDLIFLSSALSVGGTVLFLDVPFYEIVQREGSASRLLTPAFLERYAEGLVSASRLVPDSALRTSTCLSMMLGMMRVGRKLGFGPRKTFRKGRFAEVLPLQSNVLTGNRWAAAMMNHAYPLMFYAQWLKDLLTR